MEIKDARSLPSIAQEGLRQKAIKAVMDSKKQVEIAEILNVTRQAVGKWVSIFRTEGEESCRFSNYMTTVRAKFLS
jgi:transposase